GVLEALVLTSARAATEVLLDALVFGIAAGLAGRLVVGQAHARTVAGVGIVARGIRLIAAGRTSRRGGMGARRVGCSASAQIDGARVAVVAGSGLIGDRATASRRVRIVTVLDRRDDLNVVDAPGLGRAGSTELDQHILHRAQVGDAEYRQ